MLSKGYNRNLGPKYHRECLPYVTELHLEMEKSEPAQYVYNTLNSKIKTLHSREGSI